MFNRLKFRWSAPHSNMIPMMLVAAVAPTILCAQTTSATLRGKIRVLNAAGKPVAGATLTATNTNSGYTYQGKSRADGSYFLMLEPSTYTIQVQSTEFGQTTKTIRVQIGQSLELNFNLVPTAQGAATVEVLGTAVEMTTSEVATNVTTEQLEGLPVGNRSFLNFAALAPGIRLSSDPNNQSFSSGGQTDQKVNVFIDGLSYKNDVIQGGVMGQDSSKGNPFPLGAVQEFRVLTENYKAEYQKASAAIITAVTKSGSNEFHGDVFSYYQHRGLVSQNAWDEKQNLPRAAYERWQVGASVGGPLIKDKLHFFVSFENQRQDTENNVYLGWRKDLAPSALLASLQTREGTFTSPFRSNLLFGKLDWQINTSQQLEVTANLRRETDKRGFGGQSAHERGEDMQVDVTSFTAKHKLTSANWANEAMVSHQSFRWNPKPLVQGIGQEFADLMTIGGNAGGQDIKQDRLGFRDDFTYLGIPGHTIKAGINLDFLKYDVAKYFDTNPTFHYYYGTGQDSTPDWSMPAWTVMRVGNPQFETSNQQIGWYLQDDWRVSSRLLVNLGLRWDYESDMFNNDYVTPADQVSQLGFLVPANYITDGSKRKAFLGAFQPRLGFSYDLTGKGKTVLFGGLGRYYDREAFNNSLDEKFRQQSRLYTFEFTNDPVNNPNRIAWDPAYASRQGLLNLLNQGHAGNYQAFFLDNDQKQPYSDQFSLGLRHSFGSVNVQATYTNVTSNNNLTWTWGDLDANGDKVSLPAGYDRVLLSTASKTWYEALYLVVDRPYTEASGWGAGVSYTLSNTEKTGTDLFSLPSKTYDPMKRHKATGMERNRLVANGIVKLPWGFRMSGLLTLGSGPLYDYTDYSVYNDWGRAVIRPAAGAPQKSSFIIPNAWAYRSLDLKLQKDIAIGKTRLGLMFEGINVFNYANWTYDWDSGAIKPNGEVNPYFGKPHGGALNPRRWQFGITYTF